MIHQAQGARPKTPYQSVPAEKHMVTHQRSSASALYSNSRNSPQTKSSCVLCNRHFYTHQCRLFPTLEERQQKFTELNLCYNCSKPGHSAKNCRNQLPCFFCKQKGLHHQSLCPDCPSFNLSVPQQDRTSSGTGHRSVHFSQSSKQDDGPSNDTGTQKPNPVKPATLNLSSTNGNALLASDESVIMQTAFTTFKNPNNLALTAKTRLLFDCGADNTFVSSEFADKLQLPLGKAISKSFATFGSNNTMDCTVHQSVLLVQLLDGSTMKLNVYVIPKICHTLNRIPYGTIFPTHHMNDLDMADSFPTEFESSSLDILIGNDYYFDFIEPEMFPVHGHGSLYLVGSKLGWILTGRTTGCSPMTTSPNLSAPSLCALTEPASTFLQSVDSKPVTPDIEFSLKLDTLDIEPLSSTTDDEITTQQFNETVKIDNIQLKVTWPWEVKQPDLPSHHVPTYYNFRSVAKYIWAHPELLKRYNDTIQNQLKLGFIEQVTPTTPEGPLTHHVPYHPITDNNFLVGECPTDMDIVQNHCVSTNIHTNYASHLVKTCLKQVLSKLCFNSWQMITVLLEVQAVVNSCPFACVSDNIHSDMALKHSHFLVLNPCIDTSIFIDSNSHFISISCTATQIYCHLDDAFGTRSIVRPSRKPPNVIKGQPDFSLACSKWSQMKHVIKMTDSKQD